MSVMVKIGQSGCCSGVFLNIKIIAAIGIVRQRLQSPYGGFEFAVVLQNCQSPLLIGCDALDPENLFCDQQKAQMERLRHMLNAAVSETGGRFIETPFPVFES